MYSKINIASLFIFIALLFIGIATGYLASSKLSGAIALSFLIFSGALFWHFGKNIDETKFVLGFFLVYAMLPGMSGINVGGGLPVFRSHRIAAMVLLFYLFRKGTLIDYFKNFITSKTFNLPIIIFLTSLFITAYFSRSRGSTIFWNISFIMEYLFIGILAFNAFKTRELQEKLVSMLIYAGVFLAVLAIYEQYTHHNIFTIFGVYDPSLAHALQHMERFGGIRTNGPFSHSISHGAYFALLMPLVLYKFKKRLPIVLGILGLFALAILSTQSRSAQIGALMVLGLYFIFGDKKPLLIGGFFSLPVIIMHLNYFLYRLSILNPFADNDAMLQASSMERARQFEFYVGIVKKNIIFGYGWVPAPALMRNVNNYQNTIDNFYLMFSYLYGLSGLTTWVILMLATIIKPIIMLKQEVLKDQLLIVSLIGVIVFCVINMVVALWSFHFMFWIYFGIIARIIYNHKTEQLQVQENLQTAA